MGATRRAHPRVKMLAIGATIGATVLIGGETIRLGRTLPPPPPPPACLVFEGQGLRPLDYVDNLETCGARLEVLFLTEAQPIRGAYGGVKVFADGQGIYAQSGREAPQALVSPATRQAIDTDIERLIRARRRKGVIALDLSPQAGT